MRSISIYIVLVLLTCGLNLTAAANRSYLRFLNTTIEISDSAAGAGMLRKSDRYTAALTPFDLQARLRSTKQVAERDYLDFAPKQARNWNTQEQQQLKDGFEALELFFKNNNMTLNLPDTVQMIKTTCEEEFGAEGYTRGSFIVLNTAHEGVNPHLIAHELFHVFSRHNTATRDKLYSIIGFERCKPINYLAAVENRPITNPDCPVIEHYVMLNNLPMAIVLHSTKPYAGGNVLQESLNIGVLQLKGDGKNKVPMMKDGKGVIKDLGEMPEILQKTGGNTPYVLHPEEVSAEHFSMLVTEKKVPEPQYLEKMKNVLLEAK